MNKEEQGKYFERMRQREAIKQSKKGVKLYRALWDVLLERGHDRACCYHGGYECDCDASRKLDDTMDIWADLEIDGVIHAEWL